MNCPFCGGIKRVFEEHRHILGGTQRDYTCLECGQKYSVYWDYMLTQKQIAEGKRIAKSKKVN